MLVGDLHVSKIMTGQLWLLLGKGLPVGLSPAPALVPNFTGSIAPALPLVLDSDEPQS